MSGETVDIDFSQSLGKGEEWLFGGAKRKRAGSRSPSPSRKRARKAVAAHVVPVATVERLLQRHDLRVSHDTDTSSGADAALAIVLDVLANMLLDKAMAARESSGKKSSQLKTAHLQAALRSSDDFGSLASVQLRGAVPPPADVDKDVDKKKKAKKASA